MKKDSLYLKQIPIGPMENFVYLIGDKDSGECAFVDPAWDVDSVIRIAEDDGMKIIAGLLTHAHFDHSNGVEALVEKTGAKIYVHETESEFIKGMKGSVEKTHDNDTIRIGEYEIRVIHTPGHTPGGQCFLVGNHLFTGDTLFVSACGRCDLEKSSPEAMYESLQKLANLGDDIYVYPGHDYGSVPVSTLGREKERNPYYQCRSLEDFLNLRVG